MGRATIRMLAALALALCAAGCDDHDDHHVYFVVPSFADLDFDGYADLVIGAPLHEGGGAPGARPRSW